MIQLQSGHDLLMPVTAKNLGADDRFRLAEAEFLRSGERQNFRRCRPCDRSSVRLLRSSPRP